MSLVPKTLSRSELRRVSRPLLVPEWGGAGAQEKLRSARVLVVGAGGLGGPVVRQLAGAGVGALTIADSDTVSVTNLHRQQLYTSADVGRSKAACACALAQQVNPFVEVKAAPALDAGNAAALIAAHDLTVDATDNFETRYLLADTCRDLGREWVWGAASGVTGLCSVFGPHFGLRDLFPAPEADSCDELGVLGPIPNLVGDLMALQALLILGGVGEPLRGKLWTFDGLTGRVRVLKMQRADG
ncbi:HesA/MoeB/ThiF family protein [Deinococcus sp. VB343]|uniref:HesA/MoeB/ThiF family protein n=1 Tax=Deinococcus sp. VB343 TaxID=3385567 RepID=UPI0039C8F8EC